MNRTGAGIGAGSGRTASGHTDLISASKVKGTAVYDASGERIGTVDDVMLSKTEGYVAYAVMSFGGFLGIGERYHPLPWDVLDYDTDLGGYRVGTAGEDFRDAPNYSRDQFETGDWYDDADSFYDEEGAGGRFRRGSGTATSSMPGTGGMTGTTGMSETGSMSGTSSSDTSGTVGGVRTDPARDQSGSGY